MVGTLSVLTWGPRKGLSPSAGEVGAVRILLLSSLPASELRMLGDERVRSSPIEAGRRGEKKPKLKEKHYVRLNAKICNA